MKKCLPLVAALALVACAVAMKRPLVTVLYAQSLPATVHAHWTPRPSSENITQYAVVLDNGAPIVVPSSACTATDCVATLTVNAYGAHTTTVASANLKVDTDPTSLQAGPASAPVNWVLNPAPSTAPAGATVKQ